MTRPLAITQRGPLEQNFLTPESVVKTFEEAGIHISERELRRLAREIGACRQIGKALFFTEDDIEAIVEASRPCPSKSTKEDRSGTTAEQSPVGGYAALQKLRTKSARNASQPKEKHRSGRVISMGRARQ